MILKVIDKMNLTVEYHFIVSKSIISTKAGILGTTGFLVATMSLKA